MVAERAPFLTAEEYLAIEREAEFKSEYVDGRMYMMAGASEPHVVTTGNIFREIASQIRGRGCRAYVTDMKIQVSLRGQYSYPDVAVVCGQPQFHDEHQDVVTNPIVIVEVLSPSTEAYDRGLKSQRYRQMDSLQEILLAAQDRPHLELSTRQPDGSWRLTEASGLDAEIALASVGCTLRLADVYENVEFGPIEPNR